MNQKFIDSSLVKIKRWCCIRGLSPAVMFCVASVSLIAACGARRTVEAPPATPSSSRGVVSVNQASWGGETTGGGGSGTAAPSGGSSVSEASFRFFFMRSMFTTSGGDDHVTDEQIRSWFSVEPLDQ